MLSEYLLWCVEWVIEDEEFASLVPVLVEYEEGEITKDRLNGEEVLKVRGIYQDWWNQYGDSENPDRMPLDDTGYSWR